MVRALLGFTLPLTAGISSSTAVPRPTRTYLWYPARASDAAKPMRFGRHAALADADIWSAEIAAGLILSMRNSDVDAITYEEFVQAVLTGQADQAIDRVRALRETQPHHILLNDTYLQRLVWSLWHSWGLTEEAMPVIRFRVELNPSSVDAQRMLAEGHIDVEDYPAAIVLYSKILERNPDDKGSRSRLEWLRDQ